MDFETTTAWAFQSPSNLSGWTTTPGRYGNKVRIRENLNQLDLRLLLHDIRLQVQVKRTNQTCWTTWNQRQLCLHLYTDLCPSNRPRSSCFTWLADLDPSWLRRGRGEVDSVLPSLMHDVDGQCLSVVECLMLRYQAYYCHHLVATALSNTVWSHFLLSTGDIVP